MIVRIALRDLFHGIGISRSPFLVRPLRVLIESIERLDVILFARGRLHFLGMLQLFPTALQHRQLRAVPQLMPQAHRQSPMRNRALRIILLDLLEFLLCFLIPE